MKLLFGFIITILIASYISADAVDVWTRSYDNKRLSANFQETILNRNNVKGGQFGKTFIRPVDGQIYAQILYLKNLVMPSYNASLPKDLDAGRNVLFVATMNNNVYALDADDPDRKEPFWMRNLGPAAPVADEQFGLKCKYIYNQGKYFDIEGNVGIVGTPVIDKERGVIYVAALNKINDAPITYAHYLYALDIYTGQDVVPRVQITATIDGVGLGSNGGKLTFNPQTELQRGALTLVGNSVFVAFGSYCDTQPYHGWLFGYNKFTLEMDRLWCSSPNEDSGSIWNSGEGLTVLDDGNLYILTANGPFNPALGSYGSAFIRMSPTETEAKEGGKWMKMLAYYKPEIDLELGLTGVGVIPEINWICGSGKYGYLWFLDPNVMNGINGPYKQQIVFPKHVHGLPVFWKHPQTQQRFVYVWGYQDYAKQFLFNEQTQQLDLFAAGNLNVSFPGGFLTITGSSGDIDSTVIWATVPKNNSNHQIVNGVVQALDPLDISKVLWSSEDNAERDSVGPYSKFNRIAVTNGKVYVASLSRMPSLEANVNVYGVLKPSVVRQPKTVRLVDRNEAFHLDVIATGRGPLQYQWYSLNTNSNQWEAVAGATDRIFKTSITQETKYICKISNSLGEVETQQVVATVRASENPQTSTGGGGVNPRTSTGIVTPPVSASESMYKMAIGAIMAIGIVLFI